MANGSTGTLKIGNGSTNNILIRNELADFIVSEFSDGNGLSSIRHDDDLIKQGIVDSMGVLQIVAFIEQSYGTRVVDEDIVVENFRSISSIAHLVAQKLEGVDAERR